MTFETFISLGSNELALRAARTAAEGPGAIYNPLVLYGGSGTGKTHLLRALAAQAEELHRGITAVVMDPESLADLVAQGLADGALDPLHAALSGAGLLAIDGVDRLAGMARTQQELATIGARMLAAGRQIVFASRLAPPDIQGLEPELVTLLTTGMAVEIEPASAGERRSVASTLVQAGSLQVDESVIEALAESATRIDTIEATLQRLSAIAGRGGRPLTLADLHAAVGADLRPPDTDEFDSFLDDVSRTLGDVVGTTSWRRRIAEAILRWEGDGVQTRRLEEALQADSPPDVESLLERFDRDARHSLELRANPGPDAPLVRGEDRPVDAETTSTPLGANPWRITDYVEELEDADAADPWFLDAERSAVGWTGAALRLVEDAR